MKIYFNGYEPNHEPITAYIDNIVLKSETLWDGYVVNEMGVDVKQMKNIINALELIGYKVNKIIAKPCYADFDSNYYFKFPEKTIDKLWKTFSNTWSRGGEVYIKRNRLYTKVDDYEIALPKEMFSDYDNRTLRVEFHI